MEVRTNRRKVFSGEVVSDKMNKTRVVQIRWAAKHPKYRKIIRKAAKFKAHDEKNESKLGDIVKIIQTDVEDKRPVEDIIWFDQDYQELFEKVLSMSEDEWEDVKTKRWINDISYGLAKRFYSRKIPFYYNPFRERPEIVFLYKERKNQFPNIMECF